MPDTARPVNGTPARLIPEQPQISGSDVTYLLTTLPQRFTCVRLPDPHLTALPPPFPHRSPRRSLTNAACGGLTPSPAGRHRGAISLIFRTAPHRGALLSELPSAFVTHVVWSLPLQGDPGGPTSISHTAPLPEAPTSTPPSAFVAHDLGFLASGDLGISANRALCLCAS